jgi:FkbM family methyltransferase
MVLTGPRKINTYFDIGANIGGFSEMHCPYAKEINAFEPCPGPFAELMKAARRIRKRGTKMTCNRLAMSDVESTMHGMRVYEAWALLPEKPGRHGLVNDIPAFDMKVTTLDAYVRKNDIPSVDFIKLDVDGYEQRVLQGGRETIERDKPPIYIEISWLSKLLGDKPEDLGHLIFEMGYRAFNLTGDTIAEQEFYGYEHLMRSPLWQSSGDIMLVHQFRVDAIGLV